MPGGEGEFSGPRIVEVAPDDAGQRIDNFLLRELRGLPRSRVYALLRRGEVRVNSGRVRAARRLVAGDRVRIPPVRLNKDADLPAQQQMARQLAHKLERCILFEDDQFLAINKPAGVAVHGGSGVTAGVIEAVRELRPAGRLELVHRLDRDTSGALLLARRGPGLRAAHRAFARGQVAKLYRAVVTGRWPRHLRVSTAPLLRYVRGAERLVRVDPQGRAASTMFAVVRHDAAATHLDVRPETGRTHQIRVHAAHAGHPVVGDTKYGRGDCDGGRLMLHALSLRVPLGDIDRTLVLETELPEVFRFGDAGDG